MRAVVDHPDDTARRLVYADFLQHRGDPQGELIAIQVRLASLPPDDPNRGELEHRARELIAANGGTWAAQLGEDVTHIQYRLGLPFAARVVARNHALAVLDRAPIRDLGFALDGNADFGEEHGSTADAITTARQIASDPRLARIELLATGVRWGEEALQILLGSAHLAQLRGLRIPDEDAHPYAGRAIAAGHLPALEVLAICGDWQSANGDACVTAFANAKLPSLRGLALLNLSCTEDSAIQLATSTTLAQLTGLDFGWGSYNPNRIGPEGATAIAGSPNFAALARLVLDFNWIGDQGLAALAASPHLGALHSLSVKDNQLTDTGLAAFANGEGMPNLEMLEVTFNRTLTRVGIAALADSPRLSRLSSLWMRQINLGPEAARAIARSPHARSLRSLNMLECGIGDEGAAALLESPYLDDVTDLQLSGNRISTELRAALQLRWGNRVRS